MTTYGYARTSTVEQVAGLADQISKLKGAGCTDQSIYQEQISSIRMEDRIEFAKVLSVLKAGDVLVFSSLSRAARSMVHMIEIEAKVARAGATIRILDLAIDTATSSWDKPVRYEMTRWQAVCAHRRGGSCRQSPLTTNVRARGHAVSAFPRTSARAHFCAR